jgi:hypothetical protein
MPSDTFRIEHGTLIRTVVPRKGKPYEHACTLAVYEAVCHAIDELAGQPTALDGLVAATGLPHSQVNVAMAFLKERWCLMPTRGRRHMAATDCVHLDAMTEYHALKDGSPGA